MKKARRRRKWMLLDVMQGALVLAVLAVILSRAAGIRSYVVMSGSMEPEIPVGSLCFVDTNREYEDVEKGDIIAFESASGVLVTHRAAEVTAQGIVTKGDSNDVPDAAVTTEENFAGETMAWVPYAGYAVHVLALPGVKAAVAAAAVFVWVLWAFSGRRNL